MYVWSVDSGHPAVEAPHVEACFSDHKSTRGHMAQKLQAVSGSDLRAVPQLGDQISYGVESVEWERCEFR